MPDTKPTPLAEWMHLHSVSRVKMAELIGVSRQTISRIAQGDFEKVDTDTIRKLVNATGLRGSLYAATSRAKHTGGRAYPWSMP